MPTLIIQVIFRSESKFIAEKAQRRLFLNATWNPKSATARIRPIDDSGEGMRHKGLKLMFIFTYGWMNCECVVEMKWRGTLIVSQGLCHHIRFPSRPFPETQVKGQVTWSRNVIFTHMIHTNDLIKHLLGFMYEYRSILVKIHNVLLNRVSSMVNNLTFQFAYT